MNALSASENISNIGDNEPRGCRYDGQASVFGWKIQEMLELLRVFIAGAGALGCELLKVLLLKAKKTFRYRASKLCREE